MKNVFSIFLLCIPLFAQAQFSNRIWCFGDSAGIDFSNPSNPVTLSSGMDCRGSCCSIADSTNQLLFYAHTGNWDLWLSGGLCSCAGMVVNKTHNLMQNGDSLVGAISYEQYVIIPFPNDSSKFYLFHQDILDNAGLFYSVIDMNQNSGMGAVVQKNFLVDTSDMQSSIVAMKHGNGRDWWLITHRSNAQTTGTNCNEFASYLITPNGIQGPIIQAIGTPIFDDGGILKLSHTGDKIVRVGYWGLIEIFNFDRCTGLITNPVLILPNGPPYRFFRGAEFSANDSVLYISNTLPPSYILQFDLSAVNISQSIDTISFGSPMSYEGGYIKMAPDNKIYWTFAWNDGMNFNYPYPTDSSSYNYVNMNLSVINNPNLLGSACNFQPFSFYLGGKRSYYDLPNNPNYNMVAWGGSICDSLGYPNTITGITPSLSSLNIFYHSDWQTAFINASGIKGNECMLHVVDISGKEVYSAMFEIHSGYINHNLNCSRFAKGTYLVLIETAEDRLVKKFVVE